jgi:hypothetical protein
MTPNVRMRAQIARAADLMRPVLELPVAGVDLCTVTVDHLARAVSTPTAAVYIVWDAWGRCRYVGSVRRRRDAAPVRDRMREHLRQPVRRAKWYAATVLPVTETTSLEMLRTCEGWVALALGPAEGSAHPAVDMDTPIIDVISTSFR